jgi:NAD(P)-dependent dehydrogenase (short-subunit alcohol dehydrogenase family)
MDSVMEKFNLEGKVCIITGGAGLLGEKHAEAVAEAKGVPVLLDIDKASLERVSAALYKKYGVKAEIFTADITDKKLLEGIREKILKTHKRIDVLINNAANNPKMAGEGAQKKEMTRFENFPEELWDKDLDTGLKGAFLCSQIFGSHMAEKGSGVILNISSDLGLIAPDQRIYREEGTAEEQQKVKPVTYSAVKHGLIGLTRYLATYWAGKGVRSNAVCFGGVHNNQPQDFVQRLTNLIPLGRMAGRDEYKAAVLFLISDASSYMTGSVVAVEGGRTCW